MDTWFLVVADYHKGEVVVRDFGSDHQAAASAYGQEEVTHRAQPLRYEVVLIAAEDKESLRSGYPHLFGTRKTNKRAAIDALRRPALA